MADERNRLLEENYGATAQPEPPWWNRIGSSYPHKPWEWTRTYPALADFLRNALQTAPLAFPAARSPLPIARAPLPLPSAEWPIHAAVRIGDRMFTGTSHFDAVTKAQEILGDDIFASRNPANGNGWGGSNSVGLDGFLTNKGRYVDRQEAARMLDEHNRTSYWRSWLTGRPDKNGMPAEALDNYNPSTGREKWREK